MAQRSNNSSANIVVIEGSAEHRALVSRPHRDLGGAAVLVARISGFGRAAWRGVGVGLAAVVKTWAFFWELGRMNMLTIRAQKSQYEAGCLLSWAGKQSKIC